VVDERVRVQVEREDARLAAEPVVAVVEHPHAILAIDAHRERRLEVRRGPSSRPETSSFG